MIENDFIISYEDYSYRREVYEAWQTYHRVFPDKNSEVFCKNWKVTKEQLADLIREIESIL